MKFKQSCFVICVFALAVISGCGKKKNTNLNENDTQSAQVDSDSKKVDSAGENEKEKDSDNSDSGNNSIDTDASLCEESSPQFSNDACLKTTEDCKHPSVVKNCKDGWCRIVGGCFVFGSKNSEGGMCRAKYAEKQVEVELTHDYEMRSTEVTQEEWQDMGFDLPNTIAETPCPKCPITWITVYEAMAYCNKLSEKAGLPECYDLSNCKGQISNGCKDEPLNKWGCRDENSYVCQGELMKYKAYECPGYRLPTTVEWEYAARAGTRTATYAGDFSVEEQFVCVDNAVLNPIAWYCANSNASEERTYIEVGQKTPNAFGLYDMIGNVSEYCESTIRNRALDELVGRTGPLEDPAPVLEEYREKMNILVRGCNSRLWPSCCRSAFALPAQFANSVSIVNGFRPVRTIKNDK